MRYCLTKASITSNSIAVYVGSIVDIAILYTSLATEVNVVVDMSYLVTMYRKDYSRRFQGSVSLTRAENTYSFLRDIPEIRVYALIAPC